jgi:hypothetical protein
MKRRQFLNFLGAAVGCPLVAHAQQSQRMRRIGILLSLDASDAEGQARVASFIQGLQHVGGSMVTICGLMSGGRLAMPILRANTREIWSH